MDRDAILNKLRGLNAKTIESGCTEAEALAAASMLAVLIDKYGFTHADLALEEREEITKVAFAPNRRTIGNVVYLANATAEFCDCKVWMGGRIVDGARFETVQIFGHESDALLAQFLLHCFDRALVSGWHEHRKQAGARIDPVTGRPKAVVANKDAKSFELGMVNRLTQRLREMKAARNVHVDEETGRTGTSLVVVKKPAVEEAFAALGMKFGKSRKGGGRRKYEYAAYDAGRAAGDKVQITTGIGHSRAGYLT